MKTVIATSIFALAAAAPALAQETRSASPAPAEKMERMDPTQRTHPAIKPTEPSTLPRAGDMAGTLDKSAETAASGGDWRASSLIGSSIRNAANEAIGDINDLLVGADGQVSAVVVGVGGFLGIGEKNVAIPFDELSFSKNKNGKTVVMSKVTKKALESMPEWRAAEKL